MKINEVEALAGISKKNIRFYEEQGLISPRRNAENGYREYTQEDVYILQRIRLLRRLDVPIEEIRQMFAGIHTVGDGMRRHLITLEREQRNLQQSMELCKELSYLDIPISQLDSSELLGRMDDMEQAGASFRDVRREDIRTRYIAPVAVTILIVSVMAAFSALFLWVWIHSRESSPPFGVLVAVLFVFAAVSIGTVLALTQRIREIQKGEIDDAKEY